MLRTARAITWIAAAGAGIGLSADAVYQLTRPCPYWWDDRLADVVADLTVAGGHFHTRYSQQFTTQRAMETFKDRVNIWHMAKKRVPTAEEAAAIFPEPPIDAWGNPMLFDGNETGGRITSFGPDGTSGGTCEDQDLTIQFRWW